MAEEKMKAADKKAEKAAAKKAAVKNKKPNVFKRMGKFFKELKSEVSKVVWLSPKQTVRNTGTVLVIVLISAAFIALIDFIFKSVIQFLLG